jgi:hypothetical protein
MQIIYQELKVMSTQPKEENKHDPKNESLAVEALTTARLSGTDPRRGMCQKFIRETVQSLYGGKFNHFHRGTAELSRRAWLESGYALDPSRGSVIGDILYKAPTARVPAGHVGIRIKGNKVVENSSTRLGRFRGAYGIRSLEEFGTVKTIVRLPEPKA